MMTDKQIAVRTLKAVTARIMKQGRAACEANPDRAMIIKRAVDRDLQRIAFAINMVEVKL
jgi:hypothetical protein